jgi:translocation and assembly module TamB
LVERENEAALSIDRRLSMSRRARILRNVAIGLASFVVLGAITVILVVRTDRFREYVKQKVITATEQGTGGRVEMGSFSFDWTHLRVIVTDFVIHGNEPAGAAPFLRAGRVELHLGLFTSLKRLLDVRYLAVDRPAANILVYPDGSTNVPKPATPSTSKSTPLETVVDLAVGHFELTNGSIAFNSQKQNFDLRGETLRVQLWYDLLKRGYRGEIAVTPLYVVAGRNTPVKFHLDLPVELERDRVTIQHGQIGTEASQLLVDGALENLSDPKASAHIQGRLALVDVNRLANLQLAAGRTGPAAVDVDVEASAADNRIDVARSRIVFGSSQVEASGRLQDPSGKGEMQFQARVALGEVGRLAQLAMRPEGDVELSGAARMDAQRNYDVRSTVNGSGLSFQAGSRRVGGITLVSAAHLIPGHLDLEGCRLGVFGAEIAGNASLQDFARYTVNADLRHLDMQSSMRALGEAGPGYGGTVSGRVNVEGDLRSSGTKSLAAEARLSIAPARQGVPVNGRVNVQYRGDTDNLTVSDSYLALPHTRLNVNGSLGNRLTVELQTRDLRDFAPVMGGAPPVVLAGGQAAFSGVLTGRLASPQITGHLTADRFAVQGRQFDAVTGDVAASASRLAISNGALQRGAMQSLFNGSVGLQNWQPAQGQPLSVQASVSNGDLADVMALAGTAPAGYSGALTAQVSVSGTVADPIGSANLTLTNGAIRGEAFDSIQAQVNLADQLVTVPSAQIAAGPSRVQLTAEFHHPRDRFDRGQLHAKVQSNQIDLSLLHTVQNLKPQTGGLLSGNAEISGELRDAPAHGGTEFMLANLTADASGRGLRFQGQPYGDFTATARTNGKTVTYNVSSDFAGSQIHANGTTQLASGYPSDVAANISGLAFDRVLVLLQRTDIPAKGTLSATVHFTGSIDHPEGSLDATVDRGVFYDEPVDRLHARVNYSAKSVDVPQLEIRAGNSTVDATARFDHPADNLRSGDLQFRITNGRVDLAHIRNVQKVRPGVGGTLQLTADGSAAVRDAEPRVLARDLNLNFAGKSIVVQGKNLGDLTLTAATAGGLVNFALDSNLAGASIQGRGNAQLKGDYPVQAQMTFHNVTWKGLRPLIGAEESTSEDFDASTDGQASVNGPLLKPAEMSGRLQLAKVQWTAGERGSPNRSVTIENQGPVVVAMEHGVARIESLHLTGPQTDVQASGSVSLDAQTITATFKAHTDLALIRRFRRDVTSSGEITADATVRGSLAKPLINGKVQLHDASVNVLDVSAGLSNANGELDFNGSSASFRNLTGEVGGGKVTLGGFLSYSDTFRMGLRISANKIRLRLQPGVDVIADADLRLTGIRTTSVLSGAVTLDQINYAPQSDIGTILSRAAPTQTPGTPSPLLDNMKLDVQVRTSSATAVRASLAQNLQVDANLHVEGTAAQPGVLGRILINEGKLVFFGSRYEVNTGTISFFSPIRIEPVLDLSLETKAKGVDVVLRVTGPVENMKLSYTSDPPLQFQEVIGLLAAGQAPTSDPTLLANQPAQPPQTFQEMGESALLAKGLADPISNRLQRVFGVSQFRIDPTFANGSGLPQAQLTLQQQVTSRMVLTYSTALDNPSAQALGGEFTLSKQWSATAVRDEFGNFSVKLLYKRQIR